MHPYSTNCPWTSRLTASIALIAAVVSAAIGFLLDQLNNAVGWSLTGFSALACFRGLFWFFDHYAWRWSLARRVLLVPDLNGVWACNGRTLVRQGETVSFDWTATVTIRQSWSRMVVRIKTAQSESHSIAASLYQEPGRGFRLIYHYENKPSATESGLQRHSGQCDLVFAEDARSATGEYFTGQGRLTVGTMTLTRREDPHESA